MAIYHLSAQVISRADGRSAVSAAAYRRAASMLCAASGTVISYERKQHVVHTELSLPKQVPAWFRNGIDGRSENGASEFLWNAVERKEGRKGTGLAMEMNIALPVELSREQNIELARDWIEEFVTAKGHVADWALHDAPGNPHFHVMIPLRALTDDGFGPKQDHARDQAGNILYREDGKPRYEYFPKPMQELVGWRRSWAVTTNRHLAMSGQELRIDHRSHREAGIEIGPTEHVGVTASNMALNGKEADRVREETERRARNAQKIIDDPASILPILTREKSVFDERDIAKAVFRYIDDPAVFEAVRLRVGLSPELVAVAEEVIDPESGRTVAPARWTTRALLRAEVTMQSAAGQLWDDRSHVLTTISLDAAIAGRPALSEQQREAVRHVTAPERIAAVVGFAGAGKSTMLGVANDAWRRNGNRVFGAALAGKAADGLERSAGIASRTLASWELSWNKDRDRLQRGDVFVLDEAGMVSSEQLSRIVQEVERRSAKLVLVGDAMQLQPIEAGAAFRAITERIGHVELSEIWRQSDPAMRRASVAFARGDVEAALAPYRDAGMVRFSPTREAAREAVIAAWKPDFLGLKPDGQPHETLILAQTNQDVFGLNVLAREALKAEGQLAGEARFVTARGERMFARGDRVLFLENDARLGVKNGMLATVEKAASGRLTVRLDRDGMGNGDRVEVRAEEYRNLDHGYAATVHKSQGATLDRIHVLATPGMDRHLAYVAMTRHRHTAVLHAAHDDFIPPWQRNKLEAKLGTGATTRDYDEAALSGLVWKLSRDGAKASSLDHHAESAVALTLPTDPHEALDRPADRSQSRTPEPLDPAKIAAGLTALANRLEAMERHERAMADRVQPHDLRALASAFAERRGLNGHAALLPALLARARGKIRELSQAWQRLHGLGTRLGTAWTAVQTRLAEAARQVRPAMPKPDAVRPKPNSDSQPKTAPIHARPRPPFLPAVELAEHTLEDAAIARASADPRLAYCRATIVEKAAIMVHTPGPLVEAILAELRQPIGVFEQRVEALLSNPEAYGGLKGKTGLFASKASKQERERAEFAERGVRRGAREFKETFDDRFEKAGQAERDYRDKLTIAIPGLSAQATAGLRRIGASSPGEYDEPLAAATATPEFRAEIAPFVEAVSRRFGAYGTVGHDMEKALPPNHETVTRELREIINGAGVIAGFQEYGRLDRNLRPVIERSEEQAEELQRGL